MMIGQLGLAALFGQPKAAGNERRMAKYRQEQAERTPTKVEALARAYCEELGYNPDTRWCPAPMVASVPLWCKYRDKAEAALSSDAMANALRKVGGGDTA